MIKHTSHAKHPPPSVRPPSEPETVRCFDARRARRIAVSLHKLDIRRTERSE